MDKKVADKKVRMILPFVKGGLGGIFPLSLGPSLRRSGFGRAGRERVGVRVPNGH